MFEKKMKNKIVKLLSKSLLFEGIVKEDIDFFIENLVEKNYSFEENIFEEGDITGDAYFLIEGEVKMVIENKIINRFEAGRIFGTGLLMGIPKRLSTAVANTDVVIGMIPKMTFSILEEQNPELFEKIILKIWKEI